MVISIQTDQNNVPFIQLGKHQLRLDLEELDEENQEKALKELRETPQNTLEGLQSLRQLIQGESNLFLPINDDKFLMKFLRPCRFYPERAFKILKKFYKFKLKNPKYSKNITPLNVRHVFDNEVCRFLCTRSITGSRIMIINVGSHWNPKLVALDDLFRSVMVGIEIAMLEPKTQLNGVHVILDMAGLSLQQVYQFSPTTAKLILEWVQECAPVRLKGIHIVNQRYIFDVLYAMFKPFLGEKLKKLLFFHGNNRKILCEKIGKDNLPLEYGGSEDVVECPGKLLSDMLFYYQNEFQVIGTYGYHTANEK